MTKICDEVDIKVSGMQQNLGKHILRSLPKDESKHFLNPSYIGEYHYHLYL